MKIALVCCACLLSFLNAAHADLTIVQKVDGGGPVTGMTIKIKGDKARIEGTPEVTTIIDGKTGEMLNLILREKKWMRISAEKARAAAELTGSGVPASTQKPKLTATGKKETINGYETEEYVCDTTAFKASYWIAPSYPDSAAIVKQLQAMTPESWGPATRGMPDYRDFPGIPLRTRMTLGDKVVTSTTTSMNQNPLSDAEFFPPKDYTEMKLPDLESLLGGKKGAGAERSPSAKKSPAQKP